MKFNKVYNLNKIPEFERYYIDYKYCKYLRKKNLVLELEKKIKNHTLLLEGFINTLPVFNDEIAMILRWNSYAYDRLGRTFPVARTDDKNNTSLIPTALQELFIKTATKNTLIDDEFITENNLSSETDISGRNALHYGAIIGSLTLVQKIIEINPLFKTADIFGYDPLSLAIKSCNLELVKFFIDCAPESEIFTCEKIDILSAVIKKNHLEIVKLCRPHIRTQHLVACCVYNRPSIMAFILLECAQNSDLEVNFLNPFKQSLLHYCAIEGDRIECIKTLLKYSAINPQAVDIFNWSALDHAVYRYFEDSIKILKMHVTNRIYDEIYSENQYQSKFSLVSKCFPCNSPWIQKFMKSVPYEICSPESIKVMCIFAFKKPVQELCRMVDGDYFSITEASTGITVDVSPIDSYSNYYYFCVPKKKTYKFIVSYNYESTTIMLAPSVMETGVHMMIFEDQDEILEFEYHFIFANDNFKTQEAIVIDYPLIIGHRGSGGNYMYSPKDSGIPENTLKSFWNIFSNFGCTCVEFDVQLTLDRIPIIYHDWLMEETGFDAISIFSLTLKDIRKLKTKKKIYPDDEYEKTWEFLAKEDIPTLQEAFEKIDESLSFNIEIKYPVAEECQYFNLNDEMPSINEYCDVILNCIYRHSQASRKIILSSFHPEVAIALKFKQCKYPVFYISECGAGNSRPWDIRWQSIQQALRFARSSNLDGLVCDSKLFYRSSNVMYKVLSKGIDIWSYGDGNLDGDMIKFQYRNGVKGIITDNYCAAYKAISPTVEAAATG